MNQFAQEMLDAITQEMGHIHHNGTTLWLPVVEANLDELRDLSVAVMELREMGFMSELKVYQSATAETTFLSVTLPGANQQQQLECNSRN